LALSEQRVPLPATSVGWKQIGEWEEKDTLTADDELMDLATPTLLDSYLPDSLYGDWYHNVGVILAAGLFSFIIGWFRLSIASVFYVALFTALYYRTSVKKYRGLIRDEIQKEFTLKHIENDYETMDWLNTFLEKYWVYLEPSISQMVTEQANPIIASNESIPSFVKAIWIDEFTAGSKPPRIDFVKTLEVPKDDVVVMDWGFSFTPNSTADLSVKQLRNYVNQRVVVKATLFGITIPVVVHNVSFQAWARVRVRMIPTFPHFETVNVSLMEPPQVDFISKLFGDTILNWEVLSFPGLLPLINEMIVKFAGSILLRPFSFQLNVPQLLSGSNTSIGILTIKAKSAKDLKAADRILGNTIDPYLTFSFTGKDILAQTKTIENTLRPIWNERVYLLVASFTEPLLITPYDFNDDRKDKKLGQLQVDLNEIADKPVGKNQIGQFLRNSKPVGELLYDYEFSPTLEPKSLPDGSVETPEDLNTGLTKIELTEIRKVKTKDDEPLTSYTELYFNNELIQKTSVFKKDDNPTFSIPFESIVTDRRKAKVKVLLKDSKGKLIAASVESLNSLIDRSEIDREWVPFNKGEGEFKISTVWKSVEIPDAPGTGGYTEPIGVVRVLLNKAEGLRNVEKVGKSDPYARVLVNGIEKSRTDFIENELNPIWNEGLYIPVTSPNQKFTIEVMDAQKNAKDRTLGSFDVKTTELIERNEDDTAYAEFVDEELRTGRLVHKKGPKGTVTYALSFYPTLNVKTLEDIDDERKAAEEKELAKLQEKDKKKKKKDSKPAEEENEDDFEASNRVELSLAELITYNSGLFVFTVVSGEYNNLKSYLQVYTDGQGYPSHVSPLINQKNVTTPHTGDSLVRELEWSTVTFRLVKEKNATRITEAIAESTIPTLSLLKNSYHEPNYLTLNGLGTNKIKIQTQWIPILPSKLPDSDLITNQGSLELEILNAKNLISADTNGKSDPFLKVYLNDLETGSIYKTKTIKKTLNPTWNEKTSLEILNRVNSVLIFKLRDWDFGSGQDDPLGNATLELADIDPIDPSEHELHVTGPKGENGGTLYVKTSFRPRYIAKVNQQNTNIGDVGLKTISTGIGAGLGAGKTVIGGGIGVVGKVKKGIFGGGKKDKGKDDEE
jgi:Ca2+-dependent lipid-binding protein